MTAPSMYVDLDDADAVLAADSVGALHSAALAGAQIRETAAAVAEGVFSPLEGMNPRSVVLVAPSGPAARAAGLVAAILAPTAGVPIVRSSSTPPWVGPLDVVVVAGDNAGDPSLAASVAAAVRRRSEVVVCAPDEGPVAGAGAGRVLPLPPRVRVLEQNSLPRYLAAMGSVVAAVDRSSSIGDLDALADAVDAEIARHHASVEVFANPAKGLASRMRGRRVVLTGDSVVSTEVARHGAAVLLRVAGAVAAVGELSDVAAAVHDAATSPDPVGVPVDPLFHDEQIDGPRPADPLRVLAVSTDPDDTSVRRRVAVLGEVDVVRADEPGDSGGSGEPSAVGAASVVLRQSLVLAARLESAAAYLRVTAGPTPTRSFDGVGDRW